MEGQECLGTDGEAGVECYVKVWIGNVWLGRFSEGGDRYVKKRSDIKYIERS